MMVMKVTGATPHEGKHWKAIDWQKVKAIVKRLQMRIAKAVISLPGIHSGCLTGA